MAIHEIPKADHKPHIHINARGHGIPSLVVMENGECRILPISQRVAEVLLANGMSQEG